MRKIKIRVSILRGIPTIGKEKAIQGFLYSSKNKISHRIEIFDVRKRRADFFVIKSIKSRKKTKKLERKTLCFI